MKSVSLEYRSTANSESCLGLGNVCSLEVSSKDFKIPAFRLLINPYVFKIAKFRFAVTVRDLL